MSSTELLENISKLLSNPNFYATFHLIIAIITFILYIKEKRRKPDIKFELFREENLFIGEISNNGPMTSINTCLRLNSIKIDNEEIVTRELKSAFVTKGNIQNGQIEAVRLFEIKPTHIKPMQFSVAPIPLDKEFTYEILITGDNLKAKSFKYKYNPNKVSFKKISKYDVF